MYIIIFEDGLIDFFSECPKRGCFSDAEKCFFIKDDIRVNELYMFLIVNFPNNNIQKIW